MKIVLHAHTDSRNLLSHKATKIHKYIIPRESLKTAHARELTLVTRMHALQQLHLGDVIIVHARLVR